MADNFLDTVEGGRFIARALDALYEAGEALPAAVVDQIAQTIETGGADPQAVADLLAADTAFQAAAKGDPGVGSKGPAGRGVVSLALDGTRLLARYTDAPETDVEVGALPPALTEADVARIVRSVLDEVGAGSGPTPALPPNALTFNGEPLTFGGEPIVFVQVA